MKNLLIFISLLSVFVCCKKDENISSINISNQIDSNDIDIIGSRMLLIGNSFFRPYAEKLDELSLDANIENHNSTIIFRGGENGTALNFWNDSLSNEHNLIKSTLEKGGISFFGMTSGHVSDNPTDGFKQWIEYAIQNNPNVIIFISIAPFDFPDGDPNGTRPDWQTFAIDNGFNSIQELYEYYLNDLIHHQIIDQLRVDFPTTKFFTIPTGWATFNLYQMQLDSLLLDPINLFGPSSSSIFTDLKGHQGDIVKKTGGLLWLKSIYNVNLSENQYETDYNTDLHEIANQIMNNHDSEYKYY